MARSKKKARAEDGALAKAPQWEVKPFEVLGKSFKALTNGQAQKRIAETKQRAAQQAIESAPVQKTDEDIFSEAMAGVKEIREFREMPAPARPSAPGARKNENRDDTMQELERIVSGRGGFKLSHTGEYMQWRGPDVRGDIAEKLHSGEFSVQDFIDMHGMTVDEARAALEDFLRDSMRQGLCCVKVIHGRGLRSPNGPVLKQAMCRWLEGPFSKWTLAYATARACDGGLGATYVILKKNL